MVNSMGISPIEFNGAVGRTQDFSTVRQNEEQKGMVDQNNFQRHFEQEINQNLHTVRKQDEADQKKNSFDAKNKGNGNYSGDGGKNRKKKPQEPGNVRIKSQGGFDMKI